MNVPFYLTIHLGKFNPIYLGKIAVENDRDAANGDNSVFNFCYLQFACWDNSVFCVFHNVRFYM